MQHRKNYRNLDISGSRFGRLTAVKRADGHKSRWVFECDCGNTVELNYSRVLGGQLSCGCLRKESQQIFGQSHTTHGQSKTKLYRKYRGMLDRCYRKDSRNYARYGGRGIRVCDEWRESFELFAEWAYATGYDPDADHRKEQSIDRIDNDGDYCPENCRWATASEQQRNRECTKLYPYNGEMYSASEFADKFGITSKNFVYRRLKDHGESLSQILERWNSVHNVPNNLIRLSEYADKCGVTNESALRWIHGGKLKAQRRGRFWYVESSTPIITPTR